MRLCHDSLDCPIGRVVLVSDGTYVRALFFDDYLDGMKAWLRRMYGTDETSEVQNPGGATDRLRAYFDGEVSALDDIAAEPAGTAFQKTVWNALRSIRVGTTVSYRDLALRVGNPTATRAVGLANGANPISLIFPCHRVIGADGSLTGYGGGIHRKRWLLQHEGALPRATQLSLP